VDDENQYEIMFGLASDYSSKNVERKKGKDKPGNHNQRRSKKRKKKNRDQESNPDDYSW